MKAGRKCGPGCRCCNCVNVTLSVSAVDEIEQAEVEECRIAKKNCCNVLVDGTESDLSDTENESDLENLRLDMPDSSSDVDDIP